MESPKTSSDSFWRPSTSRATSRNSARRISKILCLLATLWSEVTTRSQKLARQKASTAWIRHRLFSSRKDQKDRKARAKNKTSPTRFQIWANLWMLMKEASTRSTHQTTKLLRHLECSLGLSTLVLHNHLQLPLPKDNLLEPWPVPPPSSIPKWNQTVFSKN